MSVPLYLLEGIRQVYAGRTVLDVPKLSIHAGCILGVSGHNGSGKSTLLRLLAFLEAPNRGMICFRGRECDPGTPGVRRSVTLLTQEPYLLLRSVAANVGYGLSVRGESNVEFRVREALEMVGLVPDQFLRRSWRELSGGEAQRVALAARLVLRPCVLLLDEPTSSLDPENAERILAAALLARRDWGTTLVVVSHDHSWLESVSDDLLVLGQGRILSGPQHCLE
ncbi:MAG: ABC transporter ATP-binding protein [Desulfovibrionaceae bacterium]